MRRIAIINQKGGVGKTTTAVNLGAALARLGKRVVVVDMDPQANASMNLGAELTPEEPSTYTILTRSGRIEDTLRGTSTPGLSILPAHLDLSGAELELASAIGRESILKDAFDDWERDHRARRGKPPADIILIDNPPSLGLLSVNGLVASTEVLIAVQTEFFALQGLSKLVEVVQLLRRRMNPELEITSVLACLYDSRLRLAREVLAELRTHFPDQLFKRAIAQNVKLAETPSFARTIYEYAPDSKGAEDYLAVAREFIAREEGASDEEARSVEVQPPPAPRLVEHPPTVVGGPVMRAPSFDEPTVTEPEADVSVAIAEAPDEVEPIVETEPVTATETVVEIEPEPVALVVDAPLEIAVEPEPDVEPSPEVAPEHEPVLVPALETPVETSVEKHVEPEVDDEPLATVVLHPAGTPERVDLSDDIDSVRARRPLPDPFAGGAQAARGLERRHAPSRLGNRRGDDELEG